MHPSFPGRLKQSGSRINLDLFPARKKGYCVFPLIGTHQIASILLYIVSCLLLLSRSSINGVTVNSMATIITFYIKNQKAVIKNIPHSGLQVLEITTARTEAVSLSFRFRVIMTMLNKIFRITKRANCDIIRHLKSRAIQKHSGIICQDMASRCGATCLIEHPGRENSLQ